MTTSGFSYRISGRNLAWALSLALVLLLAFYWMKFAYNAYLAAIFSGELDYGEGIVWQQAILIPSSRMYGDLESYPFLVFHYPPVYHLVVHAFAILGVPWLMAGRIVSTVSTFLLAALITSLVYESLLREELKLPRHAALISALLAGLLLATLQPVHIWAGLMRVDMLAIVFDVLGMYLALCSIRQPKLIYGASLVFVLAAFTKQTAVFGAIAAFVVLVLNNPSRTLRAALLGAVVGVLAFTTLSVATDGGFVKHVILYNVNRFSLQEAYDKLIASRILAIYPIYFSITAATAIIVICRAVQSRQISVGHAVIMLYFLLTTAGLVTLGKTGSNINYLIPWVCSWLLLIGLALGHIWQLVEQRTWRVPVVAVMSALILQVMFTPVFGDSRTINAEFHQRYSALIALARGATKPVFSEDMTILMQAGKGVPWEPSIITELTAKGVFDERKLIEIIEAKDLAFAIVTTSLNNRERYSPAVSEALRSAYPIEQRFGTVAVLSPAETQKDNFDISP